MLLFILSNSFIKNSADFFFFSFFFVSGRVGCPLVVGLQCHFTLYTLNRLFVCLFIYLFYFVNLSIDDMFIFQPGEILSNHKNVKEKSKLLLALLTAMFLQVCGRPIESSSKQAAAHFQQFPVKTTCKPISFHLKYTVPAIQLTVCGVCVSGRRSPLWHFHQMGSILSLERWVWFVKQVCK